MMNIKISQVHKSSVLSTTNTTLLTKCLVLSVDINNAKIALQTI